MPEERPVEVRCAEDEHRLLVTKQPDGILRIEASQCSIACECCQRAGSLNYAAPSMFVPGIY